MKRAGVRADHGGAAQEARDRLRRRQHEAPPFVAHLEHDPFIHEKAGVYRNVGAYDHVAQVYVCRAEGEPRNPAWTALAEEFETASSAL